MRVRQSGIVAKLPKWAQDTIAQLKREADYWRDEYNKLYDGTPTAIQVDPYRDQRPTHPNAPIYLPDNLTIRFHSKTGPVDVQLRDGVLAISTVDKPMRVLPWVTNVIHIERGD